MGICSSKAKPVEDDKESKERTRKAIVQRRRLSVKPEHVGDISPVHVKDTHPQDGHPIPTEAKAPQTAATTSAADTGRLRCIARTRQGVVPYNKDKMNQDRAIVVWGLQGDPEINLYGVFDGHGEVGHVVAQFVVDVLPRILAAQKLKEDPVTSVSTATLSVASELKAKRDEIDYSFSGTTVSYGVKIRDTLYVANAGDSRCVLGRMNEHGAIEALALSEDNKPDQPAEKARILAAGGRVEPLPGPPDEDLGPMRVWLADQDAPGLAMSRSIGDEVAHSVGVIPEPVVVEHHIKPDDVFVVWASDGVWEFINNQEACDIIYRQKDNLEAAAMDLIAEATKRWQAAEDVVDDITCVILFLK